MLTSVNYKANVNEQSHQNSLLLLEQFSPKINYRSYQRSPGDSPLHEYTAQAYPYYCPAPSPCMPGPPSHGSRRT